MLFFSHFLSSLSSRSPVYFRMWFAILLLFSAILHSDVLNRIQHRERHEIVSLCMYIVDVCVMLFGRLSFNCFFYILFHSLLFFFFFTTLYCCRCRSFPLHLPSSSCVLKCIYSIFSALYVILFGVLFTHTVSYAFYLCVCFQCVSVSRYLFIGVCCLRIFFYCIPHFTSYTYTPTDPCVVFYFYT